MNLNIAMEQFKSVLEVVNNRIDVAEKNQLVKQKTYLRHRMSRNEHNGKEHK